MTRTLPALAALLVLAACSDPEPHAGTDHDTADHAMPTKSDPIVTIATGRFMSVVPDGTYATLDHDPIPAINMGAMRMGFDIDPALDLSGYEEGDALRFRLVTSEETGFMITDICRPATDGEDCL